MWDDARHRRLIAATWLFAAGTAIHLFDHLRRGQSSISEALTWAGNLSTILQVVLLTLLFMTYIAWSNWRAEGLVEVRLPFSARLSLSRHLVPPFVIFGLVMGSLYLGFATPTEAASIGVVVAIGFALTAGRFDLSALHQCFRNTASISGRSGSSGRWSRRCGSWRGRDRGSGGGSTSRATRSKSSGASACSPRTRSSTNA